MRTLRYFSGSSSSQMIMIKLYGFTGEIALKIVLCDYKTDLARDLDYEVDRLKTAFPGAQIIIYEYTDDKKTEFIDLVRDADAVITTYVTFDRKVLEACQNLKVIALNMMGYNIVDLGAASEKGVLVCPVAEYCTVEVAEHTLALLLAVARGLRTYIFDIEKGIWDYTAASEVERIEGKTLTIFGFGRIGREVSKRCQAMGLKIQVVSRSLKPERATELGVTLVDWKTAMATSDIISNHMQMNEQNANFFDLAKFEAAKEKVPIFLNTGRGGTVVQGDLVTALDNGYIRAAGLDVLDSEAPDLAATGLLGRNNVIITPHSAFYSIQSAKALQDIVCDSVIFGLNGEYDKVSKIVNKDALKL